MTWADDMQIFGVWTPLSGIQTKTHSYVTGPNNRDKIIEIDGTRYLLHLKCGGWSGVGSVREMPANDRDQGLGGGHNGILMNVRPANTIHVSLDLLWCRCRHAIRRTCPATYIQTRVGM